MQRSDRLTPAHPKLELDVALCLRALAPFATMAGRFAPGRAKCAPPSLHHSPLTLKVRGAKSKKAPAFHDPLRHQDPVKVTVPPMLAKFPLPFV